MHLNYPRVVPVINVCVNDGLILMRQCLNVCSYMTATVISKGQMSLYYLLANNTTTNKFKCFKTH